MGKRGPKSSGQLSVMPRTEATKPRPPQGMTPRARARWREIVKAYPAEHFRAGDLPLLRAYCEAQDRAIRAEEALARDGDYIEGAGGGLKAHPACAVKIAAESLMAQLATKLRLCANSRIDKHKAGREKVETPSAPGRKLFGAGA